MNDREPDLNIREYIRKLENLDAGDKARFKRNVGRTISESHDVLGLFYRLLPFGVSHYHVELYFLVATLFPHCDSGGSGDFGTSLKQARDKKHSKGLDRRVEILLDAEETQLTFHLRQTVHFLHSKRVRINWASLLEDLIYWSHPDRFIQQRWARSYFTD